MAVFSSKRAAISTTRLRPASKVVGSASAKASCIRRAVRSNSRLSMSSVSSSLGSPATSRSRVSRSASVSSSQASRFWKRSTASSCSRTMKLSRFIAATSECRTAVSVAPRPPSDSRSGVARRWLSNRRRERKSRVPSGAPVCASIPSGFSRKKSKLKQKSKTRKSFLSSPGPNRSGHRRVPRPIICQNLIFE